jgi:hypothetical protein
MPDPPPDREEMHGGGSGSSGHSSASVAEAWSEHGRAEPSRPSRSDAARRGVKMASERSALFGGARAVSLEGRGTQNNRDLRCSWSPPDEWVDDELSTNEDGKCQLGRWEYSLLL